MAASGAYNSSGHLVTSGFDVGRVAIGQGGAEGQDLATPMQMAEVAATVANGGRLMQPTFVQQVTDSDGRVTQKLTPHVQSTVISPQTATELTDMMTHVTQEGTAAGLTVSGGVTFAGKTGTAEIGDPANGINQPWFIAFAPADESAGRGRGDDRALPGLLRRRGGRPGRDTGDGQPPERRLMQLAQDTVVAGRYRLLGRLGSGGMADVWCAEDSMLNRRVALKFLHQRFAQDEQFVERFRREASSAAGLQHPNVVGVFDRGTFDGAHFIAMEYVEGASLKDLIERGLSVPEAVEIVRQVLAGVKYAHEHGIVHRDLKPQNVLVDSRGASPGDRLRDRPRRRLGDHPDRLGARAPRSTSRRSRRRACPSRPRRTSTRSA